MSEETKEPRKVKLIARRDFKKIRALKKALDDRRKGLQEWVNTKSDEHDWWPQEWSLASGEIDPDGPLKATISQVKDPAVQAKMFLELHAVAKPSRRVPPEVTKEVRERLTAIEKAVERLNDYCALVAMAAKVPVSCINMSSGEIENVEVEVVEAVEEEDQEPAESEE